jgi:putative copper export protein/methionine-rich copper-binding protein CopC
LLRAIPEDRAELERAPARVQYWFSEPLEPAFSAITVRNQAGTVIATGGLSPDDNKLLTARLPARLPDGAYLVELRLAFASDGHLIVDTRVFFVGHALAGVGSAAVSDQAVELEVLWRTLLLTATSLLIGLLTGYALVLVPAWGSPAHRAGRLPPRVMSRLYIIAFLCLGVAVAANILALIQQTMLLFNVDPLRAITEGHWNVVRIGTRFGDTWNWRMLVLAGILAALVASWYVRLTQPELVYPFWIMAAWAAPLIIFTWSIAAHAAGALVLPWIAVLSDWLHGLAVGAWIGSLATLTLILPVALQPYTGENRRQALAAVLGRFSRMALAAAAVVIATGIYNASNWFTEVNDIATPYGGLLGVKLALVVATLAIGGMHHISLRPERYRRWTRIIHLVDDFMPTLRLESLLAATAIGLAAWIAATPVPQPALPPQAPPPGGSATAGELFVNLMVTPGGTGTNTYDIVVTRAGQPVDDLDVRIQFYSPSLERRGERHAAEPAGDGLYVAAGAELARASEWWALVDVSTAAGIQRAAFVIPIQEGLSVEATKPPSALNVLALAGVLIAGGWALLPLGRRLTRALHVHPLSLLIGVLALILGAGVVVVGIWLSDESVRRTEADMYPPPLMINSVLPDAASLARGADLLAEYCDWEPYADDLHELVERMGRWRDEELFAFTREGWRGLPPCATELTEAQRWDVVNALRALLRP